MMWRKHLLQLPLDHIWTDQHWAQFDQLGPSAAAADLCVPAEDVTSLYVPAERWDKDWPDDDGRSSLSQDMLRVTEKAVLATQDEQESHLLRAMFKRVFGRPVRAEPE